jgi:hypothetical protein
MRLWAINLIIDRPDLLLRSHAAVASADHQRRPLGSPSASYMFYKTSQHPHMWKGRRACVLAYSEKCHPEVQEKSHLWADILILVT